MDSEKAKDIIDKMQSKIEELEQEIKDKNKELNLWEANYDELQAELDDANERIRELEGIENDEYNKIVLQNPQLDF